MAQETGFNLELCQNKEHQQQRSREETLLLSFSS